MTTNRQTVEDIYPLAPLQQGMLFHSLSAPASGVYIEQVQCVLHGELNVPAFERAWQAVVERHAALRTAFVWEDLDEPMQAVRRAVKLSWEQQDWRGCAADEQRARLEQFLQADRVRGFKLSQAPLVRLALIRLADATYRLIWSYHHLLLDGWSLPLVLKEVFGSYTAYCQGQAPQLGDSRPYRDYIEWLRRQQPAAAETFWRRVLKGFSTPTPLVVERAAVGSHAEATGYHTTEQSLSEATTDALRALARAQQCTMSTLVQAAWALLLSRYSRNADVVFGLTVAGRPAELVGVETMVGLFINTLPIRVRVDRSAVLPWLRDLHTAQFELRQYEHTSLVQIQGWSDVPRGLPLFESIVVFENYPVDQLLGEALAGLEIRDVQAIEQTNYPLTLMAAAGAALTLRMIYDRARFDDATITRLLGHMQTLLAGIAAQPAYTLADLPLLTAAERQQILYGWNATTAAYPHDVCLHTLFEAQVARAPNAIAVVYEMKDEGRETKEELSGFGFRRASFVVHMTYHELNQQANRLAHHLKRLGVGPGVCVAIYMDRAAEMIPALLGILKAGGAYVPLEPSFPQARVQWILAALGVRQLITQSVHAPLFQALQPELPRLADVICLDAAAPSANAGAGLRRWTLADLDALPATNLAPQATATDLAYIVFTSGSTGTPKGVMEQHQPVVNVIDWVNRTFAVGPSDQMLFVASLCFDLSVYDVFGLLAAGGSIRLANDHDLRDPERLVQMLRTEPVTFWDSAPAALQQLTPLFESLPARGGALRIVFFSGDWIPVGLPDLVRNAFPRARVIGLGGGTEATIWSNFYPIDLVNPRWVSIPYGKPIQNAHYYILDSQLAPCPVGVAGDLYIGGECLACGYLNEPTLTAQKFIPDPFAGDTATQRHGATETRDAAEPQSTIGNRRSAIDYRQSAIGNRLYRTGDMARFWADGNIEFLGRVDHQVKIRGFRIELGEIESVLLQHPSVREVIVVAQNTAAGDKRLVAYVVTTTDDRRPTTDERDPPVVTTKDERRTTTEERDPSFVLRPSSVVSELRAFLAERLPSYMLPAAFVPLDALPLTPNGKVDRGALPTLAALRMELETSYVSPQTRIEQIIAEVWRAALKLEKVGLYDNFFDLGGHSLLIVRVHGALRTALKQTLNEEYKLAIVDLLQYPTVHALAAHLDQQRASRAAGAPADRNGDQGQPAPPFGPAEQLGQQTAGEPIAIIGMTGRFPGSHDIAAFWRNLRDGVESVTFFSDEELLAIGIDPALISHPNYVKATAVLEDADYFDAAFFGITPREAEIMDPQHRLFLECAWAALEHAGYDPARYQGQIGVYGGDSLTTYLLFNLYTRQDIIESQGGFSLAFGNDKDYLSTRVSYKLNLRGPSITVQTACSTSLVAVHLACQSLWNRESDLALAGGVGVRVPFKGGYLYQEGGIASPDGHCRAFDAKARGIVGGNGVGLVVLKRLSEALADGDTIHAVIRGSAVNNDGAQKVGYTAPGVAGQVAVIARALTAAAVAPATIGYVEAHGTGTELGDPIEVAALTQVFRASTSQQGFCAIGSVKTNIGHLDAAAGVASLIKTVLALKHQQIPPSLHFEEPNPKIDFANSPFYVNTKLSDWPAGDTPRRAGVSAFGIGGTNAHIVVEEAPPAAPTDPAQPWQILVLSAQTEAALAQMTANLAEHLRQQPDLNLADVAYTLQVGRKELKQRQMLVCRDHDDALTVLAGDDPTRILAQMQERADRPVVFLFPGQGAQYAGMGGGLYQQVPLFRDVVDRCAELLRPHLGRDLRDLLYPHDDGRRTTDEGADSSFVARPSSNAAGTPLDQTQYAQPALFVVEYALAQLWLAWGVRPQALIGHSIGEYVAATLAGVFALADALALVAARGRFIQALPAGAMLSVALPEADVQPFLGDELALAAVNGPALCVISGPAVALTAAEYQLRARGVETRQLHTSHAFHSAMLDPILGEFQALVAQVAMQPPRIPYVSNLTGDWISAEQATSAAYWAQHMRQTVRFAAGLATLTHDAAVLLEVGPGQTLGTFARQLAPSDERLVLSSLPHPNAPQSDVQTMNTALGRLWLGGVAVDWAGLHAGARRQRIPLPTYPFERQRYWVEPDTAMASTRARFDAFRKKPDIADWLSVPSWQQSAPLPPFAPPEPTEQTEQLDCWLVFCDEHDLGAQLVQRLEQAGQHVVAVHPGRSFAHGEQGYTLNPATRADYAALIAAVRAAGRTPRSIIHCWSIAESAPSSPSTHFDAAQVRGYYSLIFLAQSLSREYVSDRLQIFALTNAMQEVLGGELAHPEQATILSPCKVIPQEYPNLACRSIDIVWPPAGARPPARLLDQLLAEFSAVTTDLAVAYRRNYRWIQTVAPIPPDTRQPQPRLREGGVYLITGGLGGIGLSLAEHLARSVQAKLVLISRSGLPERAEWPGWLAQHSVGDPTSRTIRRVQQIEQLGAEVLVARADVANQAQMRAALRQADARFGGLNGVIHAAGLVGEKSVQIIHEIEQIDGEQFQPKAYGLFVLAELLRGRELDFCLLCSSLSSVLGGLGFVAYAAANIFMDAFAHWDAQNDRLALPWLSVNWDAWQPPEEPDQPSALGASLANLAITPAEGTAAFDRILSCGPLAQVIVSTGDLPARIAMWLLPRADEPAGGDTLSRHPRPMLQNAYVAPASALEQQITAIWQELLGIEQVGLYDNFFELGGHSLLATQVISRLRDAFQVAISLRHLFETPTVAGIAGVIAHEQGAQPDEQRPDAEPLTADAESQLLIDLDQLSDDEVAALLDTMLAPPESSQ
jgi:amino acid adenylation domain-containing protein